MDTYFSRNSVRGLAAAAFLAASFVTACTPTPPTITPEPGTNPTAIPDAQTLGIQVLNSELAVGQQERIAFRLSDPQGNAITSPSTVDTTFYRLLEQTGGSVKSASGSSQYFGQSLPGGGVWIVYTPFDASGDWGFEVTVHGADGFVGQSRVNLTVSGNPGTPRGNDVAPSTDTPTLADHSLEEITTDPNPDADLYQMSVGEAAASGKPTVVYFGSPGNCTTNLCGPVLAEVKAAKAQYGSRVNFIHVETHDLADPSKASAAAKAWGLPSEPWTFVLEKHGLVAVRAEGPIDRVELGLVLDRELGP